MLQNQLSGMFLSGPHPRVLNARSLMRALSVCLPLLLIKAHSWQVHGTCKTVATLKRPVPLNWHFCHSVDGKTELVRSKSLRAPLCHREPCSAKQHLHDYPVIMLHMSPATRWHVNGMDVPILQAIDASSCLACLVSCTASPAVGCQPLHTQMARGRVRHCKGVPQVDLLDASGKRLNPSLTSPGWTAERSDWRKGSPWCGCWATQRLASSCTGVRAQP